MRLRARAALLTRSARCLLACLVLRVWIRVGRRTALLSLHFARLNQSYVCVSQRNAAPTRVLVSTSAAARRAGGPCLRNDRRETATATGAVLRFHSFAHCLPEIALLLKMAASTTPTITFTPTAYSLLLLHAARHPANTVTGFLLGSVQGAHATVEKVVTLGHHWTNLAVIEDVALGLVRRRRTAPDNGISVAGKLT